MQSCTCSSAFPVLKRSLVTVVSYHRVSHQSHLGSHQCHRKVSLQAGRWLSRWHTHGERAYTPVLHSCPHLNCPRSHCRHRRPRLCWYSVLWTAGQVALRINSSTNFMHLTFFLTSSHQSLCNQTWQLDHTCVWRPRSSSHRSSPCSQCRHRSANAGGCTGRPSDTEIHLHDTHQEGVWLWGEKKNILRLQSDVIFSHLLNEIIHPPHWG